MPHTHFFLSTESLNELKRIRTGKRPSQATLKRDFLEYFEKFVYETNLHGIKQAFTSKSRPSKCFWFLVCGVCICFCFYEVWQVFDLYKKGSIATKISVNFEEDMRYPTILLCPVKWISNSRVNQLKLGAQILKKALDDYIFQDVHLMMTVDIFDQSQLSNISTADNEYANVNAKINSTKLQKQLQKFMQKWHFKSYEELFLNISIDPKQWIKCECCREGLTTRRLTLTGVCYVIDLCTVHLQIEDVPVIQLTINRNEAYNISSPVDGGFISVYHNASFIGIKSDNLIYVTPNIPMAVKLDLTEVKRESTAARQCYDPVQVNRNNQRQALCEFDCFDKIRNRLCRNCSLFSMFQQNFGHSPYQQCYVRNDRLQDSCNEDEKRHREALETLKNCQRACIPACVERRYAISSVMSLLDAKKESFPYREYDYLKVSFQYTSFAVTRLSDVETIHWDTFIGSLGGQAGLWCGASIISIIQLLSYCFCPCVHVLERKGSSIRNRFSMKRMTTKKAAAAANRNAASPRSTLEGVTINKNSIKSINNSQETTDGHEPEMV